MVDKKNNNLLGVPGASKGLDRQISALSNKLDRKDTAYLR